MRRRELISLLGGAASWPLTARAQQEGERARRICVLMLYPENDPEAQVRSVAFKQALERLGWTVGRNIQIDYIWGEGDNEWARVAAAVLLSRAPDLILANGSSAVRPMHQATRTVPIIFIGGANPVGDGFVKSLAHPGGNLTGFTGLEESIGAKLLELLKEIAPTAARIAALCGVVPQGPQ